MTASAASESPEGDVHVNWTRTFSADVSTYLESQLPSERWHRLGHGFSCRQRQSHIGRWKENTRPQEQPYPVIVDHGIKVIRAADVEAARHQDRHDETGRLLSLLVSKSAEP